MGFRLRKSIKIAPGLRVNVGKRGVSMTAGRRGASVTVGSRGTYANVGLPGTGISYRQKIGGGSAERRREQARLEREERRLLDEQHRAEALANIELSLNDTGTIAIRDSFGCDLSRKDTTFLWEQKGEEIRGWLNAQADKINGDVDLLTSIHEDTLSPDIEPTYTAQVFTEKAPQKPDQLDIPDQPIKSVVPAPHFLIAWIPYFQDRHRIKQEQADSTYNAALVQWKEEKSRLDSEYAVLVAAWENNHEDWKSRKDVFDALEAEKEKSFPEQIRNNMELMEEFLEDAICDLEWPRETVIDLELAGNGKAVWLDVDLPEAEDMPQKIAVIGATGKRLNIKNKPKTQFQTEYACHIHGIALRLIGVAFASLPAAEQVFVSGYSQRLDKGTGNIQDDYLYSVSVDRNSFAEIDFNALDQVNPVEALERFDLTRKMSKTGLFKPIEPKSPQLVQ